MKVTKDWFWITWRAKWFLICSIIHPYNESQSWKFELAYSPLKKEFDLLRSSSLVITFWLLPIFLLFYHCYPLQFLASFFIRNIWKFYSQTPFATHRNKLGKEASPVQLIKQFAHHIIPYQEYNNQYTFVIRSPLSSLELQEWHKPNQCTTI